MASITTVISFFILLLATFSYSAPVGKEFENSTPDYDYTTYQPIVERTYKTQRFLPSDDESTIVPFERNVQSFEGEVTPDGVPPAPRGFEEYTYPSSTDTNDKRSLEDFLYTTIESSTEFNRRAIRPVQSEEDVESTTSIYWNKQTELTTDVEPSSSVNSFGKYTGLLVDEPSTTSEYEPTKQKPVQTQRFTKTIAIIPGKITETKIYGDLPSQTSVGIQPVQQDQLSEVQNQSNIKKTKSNN